MEKEEGKERDSLGFRVEDRCWATPVISGWEANLVSIARPCLRIQQTMGKRILFKKKVTSDNLLMC